MRTSTKIKLAIQSLLIISAAMLASAQSVTNIPWGGSANLSWDATGVVGCSYGPIVTETGKTLTSPGGTLSRVPGDPGIAMGVAMSVAWPIGTPAPANGVVLLQNATFPSYEDQVFRASYSYYFTIYCTSSGGQQLEDTKQITVSGPPSPWGGMTMQDGASMVQAPAYKRIDPGQSVNICNNFWDDSRDLKKNEFAWVRPDGIDSRASLSDNDMMNFSAPSAYVYSNQSNASNLCKSFSPTAPGVYQFYAAYQDYGMGVSEMKSPYITVEVACQAGWFMFSGVCSLTRPPNPTGSLYQLQGDPDSVLHYKCDNASGLRLSYSENGGASVYILGSIGADSKIPPTANQGTISLPQPDTASNQRKYTLSCSAIVADNETPWGTNFVFSKPFISLSQKDIKTASITSKCNQFAGESRIAKSYLLTRDTAGIQSNLPTPPTHRNMSPIPVYDDSGIQTQVIVAYILSCYDGDFDASGNPTGSFIGKDSAAITMICPLPNRNKAGFCVLPNNPPSVNQSVSGGANITVGYPITITTTALDPDFGGDINYHHISWQSPRMNIASEFNWSSPADDDQATVPAKAWSEYAPGIPNSTLTYSFIPHNPGDYRLYQNALDSENPWVNTPVIIKTASCPTGYQNVSGKCQNANAAVNIWEGPIAISLGSTAVFNSTASDSSNDLSEHNFNWKTPSGVWNFQGTPDGTVTYSGSTSFAPKGTNVLQATFKPTQIGTYKIRFSAADDLTNSGASIGGLYTAGGRWFHSNEVTIVVSNKTAAKISDDPANPNKLIWECQNSNSATLTKTAGGVTSNIFVNQTIPPSSGTISKENNTSYSLTCTGSGGSDTFNYSPAIISITGKTQNTATVSYDCKNPNTNSVLITRMPGGDTRSLSSQSGSVTFIGLTPDTDYTISLKCYHGPLVSGTVSGDQIGSGYATVRTDNSGPTSTISLEAQLRATSATGKSWSSVTPISITTLNGTFFDWDYRVVSGTAVSCDLSTKSDNGAWGSPKSVSPTSYGESWSSAYNTPSLQSTFLSSFSSSYSWKVTCYDAAGANTSLVWTVNKNPNPPQVLAGTCKSTLTATPAYSMDISCANATTFTVTGTSGTITSQAYTGSANVPLPTSGTYNIICSNAAGSSAPLIRTCDSTVFDSSFVQLDASPRTIKSGGSSILVWTINNPNNKCSLTAIPANGDTSGTKYTESQALTNQLKNENTDINDPSSILGTRTMLSALTEAAPAQTKARGRKTIKVNYSMIIIGSCAVDPLTDPRATRIKIQVSNENEA